LMTDPQVIVETSKQVGVEVTPNEFTR
jgi:hypothetical protein